MRAKGTSGEPPEDAVIGGKTRAQATPGSGVRQTVEPFATVLRSARIPLISEDIPWLKCNVTRLMRLLRPTP